MYAIRSYYAVALIAQSIEKTQAGTSLVDDTSKALDRIVSKVGQAAELVEEIAASSGSQATSIIQVNAGIEQMSQMVQHNSASAQQVAAASQELLSQASLLSDMVGGFHRNNFV